MFVFVIQLSFMSEQTDDVYQALLSELVLSLMKEHSTWRTTGCMLEELQHEAKVPFGTSHLIAMPNITYDPITRIVRLKAKKRKLVEKPVSSTSKKKDLVNVASIPSDPKLESSAERAKEVESIMLTDYFKNHLICEPLCSRANELISSLQHYLALSFAEEDWHVSAHAVGSFAAGIASKTESKIDVAIRVDGGRSDATLSTQDIKSKVADSLGRCPFFATVTKSTVGIECAVDYELSLSLYIFDGKLFPVSWLHHSRLLATIARNNPTFTFLVNYVKSWARKYKLLTNETFGINSFGWSILVAAFIISRDSSGKQLSSGSHLEQFGALKSQSYGFGLIRDQKLPEKQSLVYKQVVRSFFLWLADQDLLNCSIHVDGLRPASSTGWISIIDPIQGCEIESSLGSHSDVIRYSLSVNEAAREALIELK